jgi:hypothetical protein
MSGVSEWLEVALTPSVALIVALVNLFYKKDNSRRKSFIYVLFFAAFVTFGVQVRQNRNERREAEVKRAEEQSKRVDAETKEANTQQKFDDLKTLVVNLWEKHERQIQPQSPTAQPAQRQIPSSNDISNLLLTQNKAATDPPVSAAVPPTGWAYYGLQSLDGGWTRRYFNKASGNSDETPQVGDVVVAITHVNARSGHIVEESDGEWVNQPSIGVIKPNDRLRVVDVYPVLDSFIWIKFEKET